MKSRELLIANLRKQIDDLEKIPGGLLKAQDGIKLLIDQLQDESKTGTPPDYNLGTDDYKQSLEAIIAELKRNIKIMKEAGDFIMSIQKSSKASSRSTQEFDK